MSTLAPCLAILAWAAVLWLLVWFGILAACKRSDLDAGRRDDDKPR